MIWFAVAACWIISFLFAGIEAGLLALDPVRLRHRAKSDDRAARRLAKILKHPERLLITVLLATNAADIIALIILTHWLEQLWGARGYFIAVAIALPVYLFLLGVLPSSLFRRFPLRAMIRLSGLLEFATLLLRPLLAIGEWIARAIFSRRKNPPRLFAGREELKSIAVQSERGGSLSSAERAMVHNVVDFTSVNVGAVMVPAAKTVALALGDTPEKVLRLSEETGIDRFPVLENAQAVGLINTFDLLVDAAGPGSLRNYMRRIITAAETESAYRLIRRLRAARIGLAAIVDARGQFSGIVALEDLVRQLVRG